MADSDTARDALETGRQWALGGVDFDVSNVVVDGEYLVVDFKVTGPLGQVWFWDRNRILRPRLITHDGTFTTTNIYRNNTTGVERYLTSEEFAALAPAVRSLFTLQAGTYERPNYALSPRLAILRDLFHTARTVTNDWTVPHDMHRADGTFRGDTLTVFATEDGYLQSTNATLSTARAGSGLAVATTNPNIVRAINFPPYSLYMALMAFDTSALTALALVTGVDLSMAGTGTAEVDGDGVNIEAKYHDYGAGDPTTGDWFNLTGWNAKVNLGTMDLSSWVQTADVYNTLTDSGNGDANVSKTDVTRVVVGFSNFQTGTPGATGSSINFRSSEATGTTSDPKLVITYDLTVYVTVTASQPAASGTVAAKQQLKRTLTGAQPAASGTAVSRRFRTVAGAQPAASGAVTTRRVRTVAGSQPAATATIAAKQQLKRTVTGAQPSASATLRIKQPEAVAGSQPAASATLRIKQPETVLGNQPSATGSVTARRFTTLIVPSRPLIWIHDGATFRRLAQLSAVTDVNRSYALWEHVRTASFTIARTDPAVALTDPDLAHVIVIESPEYPLPWVGRIIDQEGDEAGRTVSIVADSYDAILGERILPTEFTTPASVPQAVSRIIGTTNGINATGVGVDLRRVEAVTSPAMTLSNVTALDALDKLAENAGLEWWLAYTVSEQGITINVNMMRERGADLSSSVALTQPGNYQIQNWRKNGRAVAYAQMVVAGETSVLEGFTERERTIAVRDAQGIRVDESLNQIVVTALRVFAFGHMLNGSGSFRAPTRRRESMVVREELKAEGATAIAAEAQFTKRRQSDRVIIGRVYPDPPGGAAESWQHLEPGNVIRVSSASAFIDGYEGLARVLGVQPMEHERFMEIVIEVQ